MPWQLVFAIMRAGILGTDALIADVVGADALATHIQRADALPERLAHVELICFCVQMLSLLNVLLLLPLLCEADLYSNV